ncbi:2-oxo acid dehydrogenase subunit E2 [Sphaerisporangium aureirubrum]|uniref:Dihydrolipoamide acetyltransferase component of pyruvate dehydrogenase complex n=1 Tax=Sphaerisporangium aureirubrum TaxID=1544736 RepID=A0ABW1NCC4_9ACTN
MTEIRVPKLNNNDTQYVLLEWIAKDGAAVRRGDPLAVLETSKAAEEITAEGDGLLGHLLLEGADCEPGQLIAHLTPAVVLPADRTPADLPATVLSPADRTSADVSATILSATDRPPADVPTAVLSPADLPPVPSSPAGLAPVDLPPMEAPREAGGPVITSKARALMERHGIGDDAVRALGKKIVREYDIEALADAPGHATGPGPTTGPGSATGAGAAVIPGSAPVPGSTPVPGFAADAANGHASRGGGAGTVPLSRAQRRTAAVVELSHRTIPPAYTVMKVDIGAALAAGRARTRELRTLVGLTELLVHAIGGLHERFPLFFASPVDGGAVRPSEAAHVGVTFDVGKGLVIPVVKDVSSLGLKEISRALLDLRMRAMRGGLRERDLGGANIVLALHNEPGVVLAVPIVFPGHTCALSLAAPYPEVVPAEDGGFTVREVVHVGAAYDHRVVNGRDVILFLTALRDALSFPEHGATGGAAS